MQRIITIFAQQGVIANIAIEQIIAAPAKHLIVTFVTVQLIIAIGADEDIILRIPLIDNTALSRGRGIGCIRYLWIRYIECRRVGQIRALRAGIAFITLICCVGIGFILGIIPEIHAHKGRGTDGQHSKYTC